MKKLYISLIAITILSCFTNCNRKSQATIDDEIIVEYLNKHALTATKTASGLYYIITTPNPTGAQPKTDMTVSCFYEGRFMDDRVFDSNTKGTTTFDYQVNRGQVIQGWDEGVMLMRKGEKARLFLPSHLAYGKQGVSSGGIGPNTVLQFEVQLVNIK